MTYYGTIDGKLIAKKHVDYHKANSISRGNFFDAVDHALDDAKKEVRSCLEELVHIEGITKAELPDQLKNCVYGLASGEDAFIHSGDACSSVGLFSVEVTGRTKKSVLFALYFIHRYLWLEREVYWLKKDSNPYTKIEPFTHMEI
jgi:hypothetical protein